MKKRIINKRKKREVLPPHYTTLDIPLYNWNKILNGDLTYLLKRPKKVTDKLKEKLIVAKEKINEEFLREFGFSETLLNLKFKEWELALLECEWCETGDNSIYTLIEIAKMELEEMKSSVATVDFMKSVVMVQKELGFPMPVRTTSILDFYTCLKNLN